MFSKTWTKFDNLVLIVLIVTYFVATYLSIHSRNEKERELIRRIERLEQP